mmetsp:Transcript_4872/g.14746  ORF Transcript_4872/g.14746 Transcript_4872/m.14746 type:complete len:227 (-) Transcript_4872:664-1344(-)|eukprot:scaffold52724_cov26-Tisochrysis_lutea.AAC.2
MSHPCHHPSPHPLRLASCAAYPTAGCRALAPQCAVAVAGAAVWMPRAPIQARCARQIPRSTRAPSRGRATRAAARSLPCEGACHAQSPHPPPPLSHSPILPPPLLVRTPAAGPSTTSTRRLKAPASQSCGSGREVRWRSGGPTHRQPPELTLARGRVTGRIVPRWCQPTCCGYRARSPLVRPAALLFPRLPPAKGWSPPGSHTDRRRRLPPPHLQCPRQGSRLRIR